MARFQITSWDGGFLNPDKAFDTPEEALKDIMQTVNESIQAGIQQRSFNFKDRYGSERWVPTGVILCLVDGEAGSALFEIGTMSKGGIDKPRGVYDGYRYAEIDKFLLLPGYEWDTSDGEILQKFDTLKKGLDAIEGCIREDLIQKTKRSFKLVKGRTDLCMVNMFPYPIRLLDSRFDYPSHGSTWLVDSADSDQIIANLT